jgi:tRNA modification GTPase
MVEVRDTIVALSSAPGSGGRAIVRLTGPRAWDVTFSVFHAEALPDRTRRSWIGGEIPLPAPMLPLPAGLMFWPGPKTYTAQDLAELHLPGSVPLVNLVVSGLLQAGARAALPGEFTQRAFLAGKLDLTRAEAVLAVIEASSRIELQHALTQLAGGVATPLTQLRQELLDLLADVEAALDFADEDLQFVSSSDLLARLTNGLGQLTNLQRQMERRTLAGGAYRVVLAGRPNAGKSSLFNALTGSFAALVNSTAGTTRDYVSRTCMLDDSQVELVDTAGWFEAAEVINRQAQELAQEQRRQANLILLCLEAGRTPREEELQLLGQTEPGVLGVATKCDLASASPSLIPSSARTGQGITTLKALLAARAKEHAEPALAPSVARCRHHIEACLQHLRRAYAMVLEDGPAELLALALREAVDELGAMVGAVYTDDLLDRIFNRFCIGK